MDQTKQARAQHTERLLGTDGYRVLCWALQVTHMNEPRCCRPECLQHQQAKHSGADGLPAYHTIGEKH